MAIQSLDIDHCAFHLEGRLTKSGFKVIEIAARPAGGFITSHLIRLSSGHSFIEKLSMLLLDIMLKIVGQIMKMVIRNYAFIVYAHIKVEHSKIVGFDSIMEIPGVIAVIPLKEEGDEVIMPPEHF